MNMKCKNCNATMEIDPSKQEAVCPYCGAKELICDSDAVAVEKIKSSTFKEMEYAHMENQRRQQDHIEKEKERLILMGLLANLLLHLYLPAL